MLKAANGNDIERPSVSSNKYFQPLRFYEMGDGSMENLKDLTFNKYYNYLDVKNEIVTANVEFRFVDNKWVCNDLINFNLQPDDFNNLFDLPSGSAVVNPIMNKAVPIKFLKDVNIFLTYWQDSFAKSLIKYHPEYHRVYMNPILSIIDEKLTILNESNSDPDDAPKFENEGDPSSNIIFNMNSIVISPSFIEEGSGNDNYGNGFGLGVSNSGVSVEIFKNIFEEMDPLVTIPEIANDLTLEELIQKYKLSRFSDQGDYRELPISQIFAGYIGAKENFCNYRENEVVPFNTSIDGYNIISNYDLLKMLYIKQLLSLKSDLYSFFAKKSGSKTLDCFKSSDNLGLDVRTQPSLCDVGILSERLKEGNPFVYAKLNIRGQSDLSILDDEFKDLADCGSPNVEKPSVTSPNISYFDELIKKRDKATDGYCKNYLDELLRKLEFRANVAYYKNCGQCPAVKDLESYLDFLVFYTTPDQQPISCNQLGTLSKGALKQLGIRFQNISTLLNQFEFDDKGDEIQVSLRDGQQEITDVPSILKFKLSDLSSGYNLKDLYQSNRIKDFCCFKYNPIDYGNKDYAFSAKIRIEIDGSDPYFIVSDEENPEPQYRYLDIIGNTDLFKLNDCDLSGCGEKINSAMDILNFFSSPTVPFPVTPLGTIHFGGYQNGQVVQYLQGIQNFYFNDKPNGALYSKLLNYFISYRGKLRPNMSESEGFLDFLKNLHLKIDYVGCDPSQQVPVLTFIDGQTILFEVRGNLNFIIENGYSVPSKKECCRKVDISNMNNEFMPCLCTNNSSNFNYPYLGVNFCLSPSSSNSNNCTTGIEEGNFFYYLAFDDCQDCQNINKANIDLGIDYHQSFLPSDDGSKIFSSFPDHSTSLDAIVNHANSTYLTQDQFLSKVRATLNSLFAINDPKTFEPLFIYGFGFKGFIDLNVGTDPIVSKRLFIEPLDIYKLIHSSEPLKLLSLDYQFGLKSHFVARIKNGNDIYDLKFILSDQVSDVKAIIANQNFDQGQSCGTNCSGTSENLKTAVCTFNTIKANLFDNETNLKLIFERNSLYLFEYPIRDANGKDLFYLRLPSVEYRWSDLNRIRLIDDVKRMQFYFNVADGSTYIPVIGVFNRQFQNGPQNASIEVDQIFFIRIPYEVEANCVRRFIQSSGICCPQEIFLPAIEVNTDVTCDSLSTKAFDIAREMILKQNKEAALASFKEQYIRHCMSQKEKLTMTYSDKLYQTTLYYYDQSGNLIRTVAPQGVVPTISSADLEKIKSDRESGFKSYFTNHSYLSTYRFNSIQKQVSESNPDQDRLNLIDYSSAGSAPKFVISGASPESSVIKYINDRFIVNYDNSASTSTVHYSANAGNTWSKLIQDEPRSFTNYVKIVKGPISTFLVLGQNGYLAEFVPIGGAGELARISTDIGKINFISGIHLEQNTLPTIEYQAILTDDFGSRYLLTKLKADPPLKPIPQFTIKLLSEGFAIGNKGKIEEIDETILNPGSNKKGLTSFVQDETVSVTLLDEFGSERKTLDHGTLGGSIAISNVELDDNNSPIVYTKRGGIYRYNALESDFVRDEDFESDLEVFAVRKLDDNNEFVFYKTGDNFKVTMRKKTLRRFIKRKDLVNLQGIGPDGNFAMCFEGDLKAISNNGNSSIFSYSINTTSGVTRLIRYEFTSSLNKDEYYVSNESRRDIHSSLADYKILPLSNGSCLLYKDEPGNIYYAHVNFGLTTVVQRSTIQVSVPNDPNPLIVNANVIRVAELNYSTGFMAVLLISYLDPIDLITKYRIAKLDLNGILIVNDVPDLMQLVANSSPILFSSSDPILLKSYFQGGTQKIAIYSTSDFYEFKKSVLEDLTSNELVSVVNPSIHGLDVNGSGNGSYLVDDIGSILAFDINSKKIRYYSNYQSISSQLANQVPTAKDISERYRFNKVNSVALSPKENSDRSTSGFASSKNGYFGAFKVEPTSGSFNLLSNDVRKTKLTIERFKTSLEKTPTVKIAKVKEIESSDTELKLSFFSKTSLFSFDYVPLSINNSTTLSATIGDFDLPENGEISLSKFLYSDGSDYLFATNYGGILQYPLSLGSGLPNKTNRDGKYQFIIPVDLTSTETKLFAFGDNDFRSFSGSNDFNFSEVPLGNFDYKMADVASSPSGSIAVLLEEVNSDNARIHWSRNNGLHWETRNLNSDYLENGALGKPIVNDDFSVEVVYPYQVFKIGNIADLKDKVEFTTLPINFGGISPQPVISKVFKYDSNRYIFVDNQNSKVYFLTNNSSNTVLVHGNLLSISAGTITDAFLSTKNSLFLVTSTKLIKLDISNFSNPKQSSISDLPLNHTGISCRFVDDKLGYVLSTFENKTVVLKTFDGGSTFNVLQKSSTNSISSALDNNPAKCFDLNGDENLIVRADEIVLNASQQPIRTNAHILSVKDQSDRITSRFFYDEVGRLILSQNAKQYGNSQHLPKFSYMQYDALGRVTESGQIQFATSRPNGGFPSQDAMRTSIISDAEVAELFKENAGDIKEYVVQTYYDQDAEAIDDNLDLPLFDPANPQDGQKNLQNRVSLVISEQKFAQTDKTFTSYTRYSYDVVGNVNRVDICYKYNLPGLASNFTIHNTIDYEFDELNGKVYSLSFNKGKKGQFFHQYKYDAQGRLEIVQTSIDGKIWVQDAKYYYYPHGPLARVELGNDNVQGLDYYYTLQGWLKGVNSSILKPENDPGNDGLNSDGNRNKNFAPDVVGYTLNYYEGDFTPIDNTIPASQRADLQGVSSLNNTVTTTVGSTTQTTINGFRSLYNGNIAAMATAHAVDNKPYSRLGIYQYDELNRIRKTQNKVLATADLNANKANETSTKPWDDIAPWNESFNYDKNGNISALTRRDETGTLMDNLNYDYLNMNGSTTSMSNRLGKVRDVASAKPNFADFEGNPISNVYEYDASGNLKKDALEGLNTIAWTPANKMEFIEKSIDNKKHYFYKVFDGTGQLAIKWSTREREATDPINVGDPREVPIDGEAYTRDPQGNTLATYKINELGALTLIEQPIYGAARIGMYTPEPEIVTTLEVAPYEAPSVYPIYGNRTYEISNHLGNVLAVVLDQKDASGKAVVRDKQDYYAFGSPLPKNNEAAMVLFEGNYALETTSNSNSGWLESNGNGVLQTLAYTGLQLPVNSDGKGARKAIDLLQDREYTFTANFSNLPTDITTYPITVEIINKANNEVLLQRTTTISNIEFGFKASITGAAEVKVYLRNPVTGTVPEYNLTYAKLSKAAYNFPETVPASEMEVVSNFNVRYEEGDNYLNLPINNAGWDCNPSSTIQGMYYESDNQTILLVNNNNTNADETYINKSIFLGPGTYTLNAAELHSTITPIADQLGYDPNSNPFEPNHSLGYSISGTGINSGGGSNTFTNNDVHNVAQTFTVANACTVNIVIWSNSKHLAIYDLNLTKTVPAATPETNSWASNYRYGFNTQQKQDDIYGPGNQNTALYWEYDTRLGRRWNLDPEVFPNISRYATFNNSPLLMKDWFGNTAGWYNDGEGMAKFDAEVNSQEDLVSKGIKGKYVGKTVGGYDKDHNPYYGNEKGEITVQTKVVEVVAKHLPLELRDRDENFDGRSGDYGPIPFPTPDAVTFQVNLGANGLFSQGSAGLGLYFDKSQVNLYGTGSGGGGIAIPGIGPSFSLGFVYDRQHKPSNYTDKFLGASQNYNLNFPRLGLSYSNGLTKNQKTNKLEPDFTYQTLGISQSTNYGAGSSISGTFHIYQIYPLGK